MRILKKRLQRSLFDFYGDVKADNLRTRETINPPTTPVDGDGGVIYTKSVDGKLYYKSNEVSEVELSSSGSTLTTEQVQDIVGAMFSSNTETNITATYEDSDGTIDLVATDTNTQLSTEQVQDIVGAMFTGNTETRISATYEDSDGTIDLVVNDIPVDLTVSGDGTIHADNVPTLNQNTTGNAATATALTSGNKIIQGDLELQGNLLFSQTDGGPQSIHDAQDTAVVTITDDGLTTLLAAGDLDIGNHDFRAKSFTSDVATGTAPITVSSTTEVANLRAATATNLAASTSTAVQLGTIELGHASDTTIARSAAGTATIEGKEVVTINKMRDVHTVAYHYSSTAGHYITMSGATTSDSTFLSSASFHLMRVMPYDGKIIRITCFNQSSSSRNESFKLYIDGDDNPLTDNRGSELTFTSNQKGSADCPSDWTFSAGESVSIRRQPSVATQGTNISIVFEFDMTT